MRQEGADAGNVTAVKHDETSYNTKQNAKILILSAHFPPEPMPTETCSFTSPCASEAGFHVEVICPNPRGITDEAYSVP